MNCGEPRRRTWLFNIAIIACNVIARIALFFAELALDFCEVVFAMTTGIGEQRRARRRGGSASYHPHDR
jgi:hypothetical protein